MTLAIRSRDYARFLAELKERIGTARGAAARSVNHELISLYWDIGKAIAEKLADAGWGDAVVEKLSRDLLREFPGIRGFSSQNLWRMQQFYLAHSSPNFLSQAVRELRIKRGGEKLSTRKSERLTMLPRSGSFYVRRKKTWRLSSRSRPRPTQLASPNISFNLGSPLSSRAGCRVPDSSLPLSARPSRQGRRPNRKKSKRVAENACTTD
jgi:hypothetical protein